MIEDPNFAIEMDDCWQAIPVDIESFHGFHHIEKDLVAIFYSQSFRAVNRDLDELADLVANMGLARMTADPARLDQTTICEPIIVPQPWGRAIVCMGHERDGRCTVFSAAVTPVCYITLHLSSDVMTESELLAETDDLVSRVDFDRTPVDCYSLH